MAVPKRLLLAFVSLGVAPILGLWTAGSMPNPPGNGPGMGQVVVGVAVPSVVTLAAATAARLRSGEAAVWILATLAATGGLVLFLLWYVATYLPT